MKIRKMLLLLSCSSDIFSIFEREEKEKKESGEYNKRGVWRCSILSINFWMLIFILELPLNFKFLSCKEGLINLYSSRCIGLFPMTKKKLFLLNFKNLVY